MSADNVAGQLTLLVVPIFQKIQPEELTSCGWSKSNKHEVAPNVVAMTRHFNHVSFWTVQEILNESNIRSRAEVVSHFIRIAKKLHELNNLHTLWAIVSALRSAPIFRLQKTWNTVPKKDIQLMERLADLFSDHNNSEKLRQHMDTLKLPCVPYLGYKHSSQASINRFFFGGGGYFKFGGSSWFLKEKKIELQDYFYRI